MSGYFQPSPSRTPPLPQTPPNSQFPRSAGPLSATRGLFTKKCVYQLQGHDFAEEEITKEEVEPRFHTEKMFPLSPPPFHDPQPEKSPGLNGPSLARCLAWPAMVHLSSLIRLGIINGALWGCAKGHSEFNSILR